jgi:nucleoside-diphosphate-sugar epimerase
MGFHIFMKALLGNQEIPLYDDGEQSRDFTFCADIVDGTIAAAFYKGMGEVFNLGGGSRTTLNNVLKMIEEVSGKKLRLKKLPRQPGDVRHTAASIEQAKRRLGFAPKVSLRDGLAAEWKWMEARGL